MANDYSGAERRRGGPDRRGTADQQTKILIVDGHPMFRVGIREILLREQDFDIVGEAEDARGAFELAQSATPDIILMDLSLPAPGGIEITQRIKRELPSVGIICLAMSEDEDQLFDAIQAGAAAGEYLINEKVFAKPNVASRVLKEFRDLAVYGQSDTPIFAPLSPREVE